MAEMVRYNDYYVDMAYVLVKQKSNDDEIKAAEDLYAIDTILGGMDTCINVHELDERLRRDYPSIEKLQELGRNMANNRGNNNIKYDVVSAIIADLNADKYGIYVDVLLKYGVINDMKKFIDKVDWYEK